MILYPENIFTTNTNNINGLIFCIKPMFTCLISLCCRWAGGLQTNMTANKSSKAAPRAAGGKAPRDVPDRSVTCWTGWAWVCAFQGALSGFKVTKWLDLKDKQIHCSTLSIFSFSDQSVADCHCCFTHGKKQLMIVSHDKAPKAFASMILFPGQVPHSALNWILSWNVCQHVEKWQWHTAGKLIYKCFVKYNSLWSCQICQKPLWVTCFHWHFLSHQINCVVFHMLINWNL